MADLAIIRLASGEPYRRGEQGGVGVLRGHFLGGFRLAVGDVAIDCLTTRKSRSLLAYLMLNPGRSFGRETLAETIWGEGRERDFLVVRQSIATSPPHGLTVA